MIHSVIVDGDDDVLWRQLELQGRKEFRCGAIVLGSMDGKTLGSLFFDEVRHYVTS
jgi:hypothetical protein